MSSSLCKANPKGVFTEVPGWSVLRRSFAASCRSRVHRAGLDAFLRSEAFEATLYVVALETYAQFCMLFSSQRRGQRYHSVACLPRRGAIVVGRAAAVRELADPARVAWRVPCCGPSHP